MAILINGPLGIEMNEQLMYETGDFIINGETTFDLKGASHRQHHLFCLMQVDMDQIITIVIVYIE